MKTILQCCLLFVLFSVSLSAQTKSESLSFAEAQKAIDQMLANGNETVALKVTAVYAGDHLPQYQDEPVRAFAWCDVFREGQFVGSTLVRFTDDGPVNEIWSRAFADAEPIGSAEKEKLAAATNRLMSILFDVESSRDRFREILPTYVFDVEDKSGDVRQFLDFNDEDEATIRKIIPLMLEALSLEGMGIVGGVITEEDLEELADAHEDIADDLSAQASVAEAFVAGLRSRVLAMDAARLGQVRLLASRLGLMQVHKDLNEHDGELRVPGLPPSSPLYHTGDGEFGFLLAWYGDELKIVRILID